MTVLLAKLGFRKAFVCNAFSSCTGRQRPFPSVLKGAEGFLGPKSRAAHAQYPFCLPSLSKQIQYTWMLDATRLADTQCAHCSVT